LRVGHEEHIVSEGEVEEEHADGGEAEDKGCNAGVGDA